jgi:hypothetical protein
VAGRVTVSVFAGEAPPRTASDVAPEAALADAALVGALGVCFARPTLLVVVVAVADGQVRGCAADRRTEEPPVAAVDVAVASAMLGSIDELAGELEAGVCAASAAT